MRKILDRVAERSTEFERHPLFAFLRDVRGEPERGLVLAPALSHFVMTFADIYRFVLRAEPATDEYQKLVNAHTYEDGGHWKWFLADLKNLGYDKQVAFSDALRFVWSEETIEVRKLSYHICQLGLGATSIEKLALVFGIEATGSVMLREVAPLGRALAERSGQNLVYFGPHHFDTESNHTLEQDDVNAFVEGVELEPALRGKLCDLVDQTFALFTRVADEMQRFVHEPRAVGTR